MNCAVVSYFRDSQKESQNRDWIARMALVEKLYPDYQERRART